MENQDYQFEPAPVIDNGNDSGDKKATASMVCGIVGLVLCACGPLGVVALVLGILAKKDGSTSGKATAGIVMGAIIVALWIISLIITYATPFGAQYLEQVQNMMG